jgi:uncharacterized membrane protein
MTITLFSEAQKELILDAITQAEKHTSGEIRVHLEGKCKVDPVQRAFRVFKKLGMEKTNLRNGVLFYVAVSDKKLAIIGDKGIHELVPENFWLSIKNQMVIDFQQENFTDGLVKGILAAGQQLKFHFPYANDDVNELTNDISFE